MRLGIDRLMGGAGGPIKAGRTGILAHRASVDSSGRHILNLARKAGLDIGVLFGPEHGFETLAQDMEPVTNKKIPPRPSFSKGGTGELPVYSLYGERFESLKPTSEMLNGIDYLIVDLQDIGARYYTYIYTMAFCMQTAAVTGTKVIVCDRPNPINGFDLEGPLVESGFESFVGLYPLPIRHGMTIGELAALFNTEFGIGCDLEIVKMEGWKRDWLWDETGLRWINPSPNMRSLAAALLYPGMCLLEGTNISEGRGTATPFEICGAPFVDGKELAKKMNALNLAGIKFHPDKFTPTMQKWQGKECGGVRFEVTDRKKFRPYRTGLALIYELATLPGFKWRTKEYEFRSDIPAIDMLTGSAKFRGTIENKAPFNEIEPLTKTPEEFLEKRERSLLY